MKNKLNCILLIDDDLNDTFIHGRAVKDVDASITVVAKHSGIEALEYLTAKENLHSDLIFLDINMPKMNGWEFLAEYGRLDKEFRSHAIIVMLTASDNLDDLERAKMWSFVTDHIAKPLTKEVMKDIVIKYFNE
jgi:CheY-like chemotaxis protein